METLKCSTLCISSVSHLYNSVTHTLHTVTCLTLAPMKAQSEGQDGRADPLMPGGMIFYVIKSE